MKKTILVFILIVLISLSAYKGKKQDVEQESFSELEEWLAEHSRIRTSIVWILPFGNLLPYTEWSITQKEELFDMFKAIRNKEWIQLLDPPPNLVQLADDEYPTTVLEEANAWPLYLAHVAQSLVVEIDQYVPWSIVSYSDNDLAILFDSRKMFSWDNTYTSGGYMITNDMTRVVPAPPDFIFDFLNNNDLISNDRLQTIGRVIEWCRQNMSHYTYGFDTKNVEDNWHYRGFPPLSRIIEGTIHSKYPEWGIEHITAGCHGTSAFLHAVLRVVNIPASRVYVCGHALPYFSTEGKYLSHGDDPYNRNTQKGEFPAVDLLFGQSKYNEWFGPQVDYEDKCNNVGRQVEELYIEYLPDYLLRMHCSDIEAGRSHDESQVYEFFKRYYTLADLEAMNLWSRIDEKITRNGGCNQISLIISGGVRADSGSRIMRAQTGLSGVIMTGLLGNPTTNASGNYSAKVAQGWTGTVIPNKESYIFSPSSQYHWNVTSDRIRQNFMARAITYTISGFVKDAESNWIERVSINFSNNGGKTYTDSSGYYNHEVLLNWSGTATPSKVGYTFSPSSRNYSKVSSNKVNQDYIASIIQPTLTLKAGTGGTTDPLPGTYAYEYGTEVAITAVPYIHYIFNDWSGDISGKTNPITITMNSNKSITANFRLIYPPSNFTGQKVLNRSLSQAEYINILTWEANSNNEGITIVEYKIYQIEGNNQSLLAELSPDQFEYWHRKVEKDESYTYAIVAVNNENIEGDPAYITVK